MPRKHPATGSSGKREMDTARKPSLEERRDTLLDLMWREKGEDLRERRRAKLRAMGFSERAVRERDGVVAAYLEDRSPAHHGLPYRVTEQGRVVPAFSNPHSGRKRKRMKKLKTGAPHWWWGV